MTVVPVSVVIVSSGRPEEVGLLVERLLMQTLPPRRIVLSIGCDADLPPPGHSRPWAVEGDEKAGTSFVVLRGAPGTCAQRNRALEFLRGFASTEAGALTVFYDDDFVPSRGALEGIVRAFASHTLLVGCDGVVLADGAIGPGIDDAEAVRIVAAHDRVPGTGESVTLRPGLTGLYGCNMTYRARAIDDLRFDELLSGYGWLEDVDFANRVVQDSPGSMLGSSTGFAGVHRGVKKARPAGRPLGYSQVANPVYLVRKGSMARWAGARIMCRNIGANLRGSLVPEPWVDRRGRLIGNLMGLSDLVTGRLGPGRA